MSRIPYERTLDFDFYSLVAASHPPRLDGTETEGEQEGDGRRKNGDGWCLWIEAKLTYFHLIA
jgi:hypothetical protein